MGIWKRWSKIPKGFLIFGFPESFLKFLKAGFRNTGAKNLAPLSWWFLALFLYLSPLLKRLKKCSSIFFSLPMRDTNKTGEQDKTGSSATRHLLGVHPRRLILDIVSRGLALRVFCALGFLEGLKAFGDWLVKQSWKNESHFFREWKNNTPSCISRLKKQSKYF